MPVNKFGISYYSANDPDHLEWSHPCDPSINSRPDYLHPQYRPQRYDLIDGVKCYQLRKVENGVHHGSMIYHDTESGNNRLYITGAQIREQRREAALKFGEDSEEARKIGRNTMETYRQEGYDFRTYGTPAVFNGYNVKSKWKIVNYETAEQNEEVLELTGDRTGNTIDQDLKFHFTRFEGNNEEALKDVERYRYYFELASVKYNPKVDKATHRNSKRFWDGLRREQQRLLENELLEEHANIEVEIPVKKSVVVVEAEIPSDAESEASVNTIVDVSMEVNIDDLEQKVIFSKSFSDDSLKSSVSDKPIIDLKEFIRNNAIVRKRSRIPKNIMNHYNSSSSISSSLPSSSTAHSAAASNEAPSITVPETVSADNFPQSCFTLPAQPKLVIAPTSINFDFSEAPTVTPPTPFIDLTLEEVINMKEKVGSIDVAFKKMKAARGSPPKMMLLAEPTYKSIITESVDDSQEEMEVLMEEYHKGAELDDLTIKSQEAEICQRKKIQSDLQKQVNTLKVAGSAMNFIINSAIKKFETPRFSMDLNVSVNFRSSKGDPQITMVAKKSDKSENFCLLVPRCETNSPNRCTHCELQWAASLVSVIWSDAIQTANLSNTEFLTDYYNPNSINGPPPDYFSRPGELALTELEEKKLQVKRVHTASHTQNPPTRRRIDSEEISSADDSVDRDSPAIKGEEIGTYRVSSDEVESDEEFPEFTELPVSVHYDSNYDSI